MQISKELPTAQEYVDLRIASNMGGGEKSLKNANIALKNSIYVVSVRDGDKLIGMGRIIGDGAITFVVSDIMVDKKHQGKGIGKLIMSEIDHFFDQIADNDSYITLIAVKPVDKLYSKFNFTYCEPSSVGMIRNK